jgi:DNA-binding transcriptional MerR regulator
LRIGELAEKAQVSKRTVDYYTQLGLLKAERSESNYRYYSEDSVQQMELITILKQHMTLDEIKKQINGCSEPNIELKDTVQKMEDLTEQLETIHEEVLKLKPYLDKLNEQQLKLATKPLTNKGASLLQTLLIMLGENPLL